MRYCNVLFIVIVLILAGCQGSSSSNDKRIDLHVLAAASLSDVLTQLEKDFENDHPEIDVILSFASSGTLQRQIEQGAPADIFLSASEKEFNQLNEKNLLHADYQRNLLSNQLVLITNKSTNLSINDPEIIKDRQIKRISIGAPESVPAGKYAKESLENMDLWNHIEDKIIYAKDVRQVLSYIETGNVDAGIVYASDAMTSSKVKIQKTIDADLHTPIIYPAGVLGHSEHPDAAKTFFTFLQTNQVKDTFKESGFKPID